MANRVFVPLDVRTAGSDRDGRAPVDGVDPTAVPAEAELRESTDAVRPARRALHRDSGIRGRTDDGAGPVRRVPSDVGPASRMAAVAGQAAELEVIGVPAVDAPERSVASFSAARPAAPPWEAAVLPVVLPGRFVLEAE